MAETNYEEKMSTEITYMLILFLITAVLLCCFTSYTVRLSIEQQLKRGDLRLFDNQYSCQMTGKYVSEERLVPMEITIDKLPKDIQQKLKEMK